MSRFLLGLLSLVFLITYASAGVKAPKEKAPPEATAFVDCNEGDRIIDALATPALNLTIEINGICSEDVSIDRTNVTLRGDNPLEDGIRPDPDGLQRQALTLRNVSIINIENLTLTGAFTGIGINDSFGVNVTNCRLENNHFAGAIIGTASGSINFTDTIVSAPIPPGGARLLRGIWVANASFVRCLNCTINDYRDSLYVSTGAQLYVEGGSFTAGRRALTVLDNASTDMTVPFGSTDTIPISGYVRIDNKGFASLRNVLQSDSGPSHSIRRGASLVIQGSTSLNSGALVGEFANMTLLGTSTLSGNLSCFNGGDAYCADPATQTSSANCGQCMTPSP
ncbi:MAG: hypothetical protein HKN70_00730 [Gammaproteobacteria bacterium]|nr:hypothetical protein [Gammaproteobacteria bacterium]